ncbi:methyltransferase (TIGR00027 family) [Saccharopolyspora lacisalsi]|uniref:S-adenosyl-L-methionine-dependent methyltransferase n=1 Tax=Halosaccharopolyspora lacisalsi TaxID=1000566 RepID=A0A839E2E1_9PSEU|nr:SAM-dependent methyltransferase [Halosaccharopolyspora lacisalsi]MBA8825905.1 methyltransferase (TIGR00027 family) [Halosaccharopolyspora lacisalsi]
MAGNQQWDIVSGIGATALAVAVGRALETERGDGLVDDPHAEPLVRAADSPIPMPGSDGVENSSFWGQLTDYIGVRSRFFDTWFEQTWDSGVRQVVILASGLDTRAFRLPWPSGTRVFEIDQPKVLEFKDSVLRNEGVRADCERHTVATDLREDWASALKNAGFDTGLPTAWLAEGLLPYLPAEAEQRLLETVHGFSAPGSHLAIENVTATRTMLDDQGEIQEFAQGMGIDLSALMSSEERADAGETLAARGWTVAREPARDVAEALNRELRGLSEQIAAHGHMLTARLPR